MQALRKKGAEAIAQRQAMYRNHPSLIDDFQRDLTYSSQHAHDKQDKLHREQILHKLAFEPLSFVQGELFAFCQKKVIGKLNHDLEKIKEKKINFRRHEKAILQSTHADTMQQRYLKGTAIEQRLITLQEKDKIAEQQRSSSCEHSL